MAIGEAEAFSERMKRELVALESANVYALMETESVVEEVCTLLSFVDAFLWSLDKYGIVVPACDTNLQLEFWVLHYSLYINFINFETFGSLK